MIKRTAKYEIVLFLEEYPVVDLVGTRQVGKTTLAEENAASIKPDPVYLDLESLADQAHYVNQKVILNFIKAAYHP